MSLLRTAIVVSLGVALMPTDKAQQERLYAQAAAAATWTITFCDRNPTTCTKAAEAWQTFAAKAQFAAAMTYDIIQQARSDETPPEPAAQRALTSARAAAPAPRGTLTAEDLKPAWGSQPAPTRVTLR